MRRSGTGDASDASDGALAPSLPLCLPLPPPSAKRPFTTGPRIDLADKMSWSNHCGLESSSSAAPSGNHRPPRTVRRLRRRSKMLISPSLAATLWLASPQSFQRKLTRSDPAELRFTTSIGE